MGGALGLMACSDVVLAEANSQFCFSEVKLGLAPAVISRFILARTTLAATSPWMISGKLFGIAEAVQMGLVHETGTTLELEKHLAEWLKSFMEAAPSAVSDTKKLLMDLPLLPESEQRTLTTDLIAARRISVEGQEGLRAFLEKRQASWKEESQ
jgi:methylglutaconyl-CoA hydratase